jgi:GntR family transcriptional regulator of arabinose operon
MKKYELVKNWVLDSIEKGYLAPGDKLPSESELINKFGISRNSVRQAINELIRAECVESKRGIGTFILRRQMRKNYNISFLCYRTSSYIFPKIIHGCNKVIQKSGFHLLINESWYDLDVERQILKSLLKNRIEGMIITPVEGKGNQNNLDLLLEFEHKGIPVLLLDNYFPKQDLASVALDDYKAGRMAAEYLWERGHRNIGVIYSTDYYPKRLRFEGIQSFLLEKGTSINPEHIIELPDQGSGIRIYRKIKSSLVNKKTFPTAFICSSDDEAIILIHNAKKMGLNVPECFSVISFDNSDTSNYSHPRLTTMNHPSEYMGELAASLLINRLNYPEIKMKSQTLIESYVVKRDSVADLN